MHSYLPLLIWLLSASTASLPNELRSADPNSLISMYELKAAAISLPEKKGRLQGASVKGRLVCGSEPLKGAKIKIIDRDPRPDLDDLLGDVYSDEEGYFHVSGATREDTAVEVFVKVYHDCLDPRPCQRKVQWKVPDKYYNNGSFTDWFDIGTVNMELGFAGEERDCRH